MAFASSARGLAVVLLSLASSLPVVRAGGAAVALEGLQAWLDGTTTLEARFEQVLVSGAFGPGEAESGDLYLSRPGRMRWDYRTPERKVALLDGRRTRLYIAEDAQIVEGTLDDTHGLLPALLAEAEPLAALFEPSLPPTDPGAGSSSLRLQLEPRDGAGGLHRITLTLHPKRYAVEAAEVLDGSGNRVLYRFRGLKRNRRLPEATFEFEPPPGTEVLKQP